MARTLRMPSRNAIERRPGWWMAIKRPMMIAIGSATRVPWKPSTRRIHAKNRACSNDTTRRDDARVRLLRGLCLVGGRERGEGSV